MGHLQNLKRLAARKVLLKPLSHQSLKESALFKKFEEFVASYQEIKSTNYSSLSQMVEDVVAKFKLKAMYNPSLEEDLNRILNIEQFVSSVKDFESLNPQARPWTVFGDDNSQL